MAMTQGSQRRSDLKHGSRAGRPVVTTVRKAWSGPNLHSADPGVGGCRWRRAPLGAVSSPPERVGEPKTEAAPAARRLPGRVPQAGRVLETVDCAKPSAAVRYVDPGGAGGKAEHDQQRAGVAQGPEQGRGRTRWGASWWIGLTRPAWRRPTAAQGSRARGVGQVEVADLIEGHAVEDRGGGDVDALGDIRRSCARTAGRRGAAGARSTVKSTWMRWRRVVGLVVSASAPKVTGSKRPPAAT